MEKILSLVRRCVEDYDMIQAGDRVAVGVSGGKDSLVTLTALAKLSRFYPKPFTVEAFTLDMGAVDGGEGIDFGPVSGYCETLGVPFTLLPSEISHIIFDLRKEKNPCSMCAKMRRGALHNAIAQRGIRKIALGHHFDDAVETFFLSLFYEGRLSCFQPVTELSRTGITQIRPLLYCGEGMVRGAARRRQPCRWCSIPALPTVIPSVKRSRSWWPSWSTGTRGSRSGCLVPCSACPCPSGGPWSTGDVRWPRRSPLKVAGRRGRRPERQQRQDRRRACTAAVPRLLSADFSAAAV